MSFNQQTIRQKLLQIYSGNSLADIDVNAIISEFYSNPVLDVQLKIEQLSREPVYLLLKSDLSEMRQSIEHHVFKQEYHEAQEVQEVQNVLTLVLNRAIFYKSNSGDVKYLQRMTLLNDLIKGIFIDSQKWPLKIVDHYHFVFPFLTDWYSFFLSYTNKNSFELNRQFQSLLGHIPSKSENQVARYIAEKLHMSGIVVKSFIDEREIEYGEDFKAKVDSAIITSVSFVQVISNATFTVQGTNWCRYEYQTFKKSNNNLREKNRQYANALDKNVLFLVMGPNLDDVKPALTMVEDDDWLNDIVKTNYKSFYEPGMSFDELRLRIKTLTDAVINNKNRLIKCIT